MPATASQHSQPSVSRRPRRTALAALGAIVLLGSVVLPAGTIGAATAVGLGTAGSFGVLGASAVTNTGPTVVAGHVGVYLSPTDPVTVTGFPPGTVIPPGTIHENNAVAAQAQEDAQTAYNALLADPQPCQDLTGTDLGNRTLLPGVYCFASSAQLTNELILNAQADPAAAFVFRIGSTLTTASDSSVTFTNDFASCNVFWQVGSSATLGTGTDFVGTLIAHTSITATTGADVEGRLLALNGAVTLDTNVITQPDCSTAGDEEPVDETPVDETPVDPEPVDETPVDETPVDEAPVDEAPAEVPEDGTPTDGAGSGTPIAPATPADVPVGPLSGGPPVFTVTGGPATPGVTSGPGAPRLADTGSSLRLGGFGLLAVLVGSALVLATDPKRTVPLGRHLR